MSRNFDEQLKKKYGDLFTSYEMKNENGKDVLLVTCPDHGVFETNVHNFLYQRGCIACKNISPRYMPGTWDKPSLIVDNVLNFDVTIFIREVHAGMSQLLLVEDNVVYEQEVIFRIKFNRNAATAIYNWLRARKHIDANGYFNAYYTDDIRNVIKGVAGLQRPLSPPPPPIVNITK